jgi:hypothetical protein
MSVCITWIDEKTGKYGTVHVGKENNLQRGTMSSLGYHLLRNNSSASGALASQH